MSTETPECVCDFDTVVPHETGNNKIEAIRHLKFETKEMYIPLKEIQKDVNSKIVILTAFKLICSLYIRHDILSKFNVVSKMLRSPNFNLNEVLELLNKLNYY